MIAVINFLIIRFIVRCEDNEKLIKPIPVLIKSLLLVIAPYAS